MKCSKLLKDLCWKYDNNGFSLELFPKNTITAKFKLIQISHFMEPGFFKSYVTTRIKLNCKVLPRPMELFDIPGVYESEMNGFLTCAWRSPMIFNPKVNQYVKNEIYQEADIKIFTEDDCPCTVFINNMKKVADPDLYFNVTMGIANMMLYSFKNMLICYEADYRRKIGSYDEFPSTMQKIEELHGYRETQE